jgi:ATP-dependent DNA helicase RecG
VQKLLRVCGKEALSTKELMKKMGLLHRPTFLYDYLKPALEDGLLSMTNPDNPKSPKQKYIITEKGKAIISKKPGQKKK